MALRPTLNTSLLANASTAISGPELSRQFASQAFPECQQKRQWMDLRTTAPGQTELFIDGQALYRFQPASDSSFILQGTIVYFTGVAANNVAFQVVVAGRCINNVVTLNAAATVTKLGASAAAFAVAVAGNQLTFTGTPVGGDTNQRWAGRMWITEITDIG